MAVRPGSGRAEATKMSPQGMGDRVAIQFSVSSIGIGGEFGKFDVTKAFELAWFNSKTEDEYAEVVASYIPFLKNEGAFFKFAPKCHGRIKLAIIGVVPLSADRDVARLDMFICEDANRPSQLAQDTTMKVADLSILRKDMFVQAVYDFASQTGDFMMVARDDDRKYPLTRMPRLKNWTVTSIPKKPSINCYYDPDQQIFVPYSQSEEDEELYDGVEEGDDAGEAEYFEAETEETPAGEFGAEAEAEATPVGAPGNAGGGNGAPQRNLDDLLSAGRRHK